MSLCRLMPSPVPPMPAERDLLVQRLVEPEVGDPAAAVLFGDGHAQEAALAGRGEHLARADAGALPLDEVRDDFLLGEGSKGFGEGDMVVVVVLAIHGVRSSNKGPERESGDRAPVRC